MTVCLLHTMQGEEQSPQSCLGQITSNLDSCACTHSTSSLAWMLRIITTPLHRQLLTVGRQRQACKVCSMSRAHLGIIG